MSAIPESYFKETTGSSGSLEWFSYETQDYREGADNKRFIKYACVYLPAGYDKISKYNILYLMHGWTGYAGEFFDNPDGAGHDPYPSKLYTVTYLKNIIDHMVENKDIDPVIIVTPTFYPDADRSYMARDTFHREFARDLMPALEHYRTYAVYSVDMISEKWDKELKKSRDHRAFGGFSYGAFTTWLEFQYNYDYIRFYLPMSGVNTSPQTAFDVAEEMIAGDQEFYIYAATGTKDVAIWQMNSFVKELMKNGTLFSGERLQ